MVLSFTMHHAKGAANETGCHAERKESWQRLSRLWCGCVGATHQGGAIDDVKITGEASAVAIWGERGG